MLAVPATSADNERSFSSAGFTLSIRRNRLEVEHFRMEHRIRRFLVAGTSPHEQEGRETLKRRAQVLLGRLTENLQRASTEKDNAEASV